MRVNNKTHCAANRRRRLGAFVAALIMLCCVLPAYISALDSGDSSAPCSYIHNENCGCAEQTSEPAPAYNTNTVSDDTNTVTVTGPMPEEARLEVRALTQYELDAYVAAGVNVVFAYDIKIMAGGEPDSATGKYIGETEFQPLPNNPVTVSITSPEPIEATVEVLHITQNANTGETTSQTVATVAPAEDGTVEFPAEGFSIYIGTTVQTTTPDAYYYDGTNFYTEATCQNVVTDTSGGEPITRIQSLIDAVNGDFTVYMTAAYAATGTTAEPESISGGTHTVTLLRSNDANGDAAEGGPYTGALITVASGCALTLANITVDGGAVWSSADLDTRTNNGISAESAMVSVSGSLTLQSGAVLKNNDNTGHSAGGVSVTGAGSALTINGGSISNNATQGFYGGGVDMDGGSFTMSDGTISGNTVNGAGGGVSLSSATAIMTGGEISGNAASGGGGGAYVSNGSFNMSAGFISNNTARDGGGVSVVDPDATFTLAGGTISGNAAQMDDEYGMGGNGGGVSLSSGATFIMNSGTISGNTADGAGGGGVYVTDVDTNFTINGGTISGNEASSSGDGDGGGGAYVNSGTFTVTGGEISGNTANAGSGVYVRTGDYYGDPGILNLSGSPTIADAVYLTAGKVINVTGAFTPTQPVPVTSAVTTEGTVIAEYGETAADCAKFSMTDTTLSLTVDSTNNTRLVIAAASEPITFDLSKDRVTLGGDTYSGRDSSGNEITGAHNASNKYYVMQTNSGTATTNTIQFSGTGTFDLTIHGINVSAVNSILIPAHTGNVKYVTLRLSGENRLHNITYYTTNIDSASASANSDSTLYITSISGDGSTDGTLTVNTTTIPYACIGGTGSQSGTTGLTIAGGTINATQARGGTDANDDAVIGAGSNGYAQVFITGGSITAAFNNTNVTAAAIGGGGGRTSLGGGAQVCITGGTVNATTTEGRVAIGAGSSISSTGSSATVEISAGIVTATGNIGGGNSSSANGGSATINISGGRVTVDGGIGGGNSVGASGGSATINISGGTISANNISGGHGSGGSHAGGTLTVTGGSAKVDHICPVITTTGIGDSALSYNVFVSDDAANVQVTAATITPALTQDYGLNDVYTDADGRLYLWLPENHSVTEVTADGIVYPTDTQQAAAYISPAAINGYIDFGQELTAALSGGDTAVSYQWMILQDGVWSSINGATSDRFTPTVYDIGEIRVVINDTYTSLSVTILPPQISVTVPTSTLVTVNAAGACTVSGGAIENNSAVPVYVTGVSFVWLTDTDADADELFADYTAVTAKLTLGGTQYSFNGATPATQYPTQTNGVIAAKNGDTPGTLPLPWEFALGSGNYINLVPAADEEMSVARITYIIEYKPATQTP